MKLKLGCLLGLVSMVVVANAGQAQTRSDWTWVRAGTGYHVYGYQLGEPGRALNDGKWVQVGTSEWNQHLIKIYPACAARSVKVTQGWLVRPNGSREVWSEATIGRFSDNRFVQEEIVATLVSLACGDWWENSTTAAWERRRERGGANEDRDIATTEDELLADRLTVPLHVTEGRSGYVVEPRATVQSVQSTRTLKAPLTATALCKDGSWSYDPSWREACKDGAGIASWVKR